MNQQLQPRNHCRSSTNRPTLSQTARPRNSKR